MNQKFKIYFCGSLRGCTPLADIYKQIVDELEKYGTVLNRVIAYPDGSESKYSDEQIYERDLSYFQNSNIMIAETTSPSHGVGIELGWAIQKQNYPILSISKKEKEYQTSALIRGCDKIACKEYSNQEDIAKIIQWFMEKQKK